jgi:hypothetical protein
MTRIYNRYVNKFKSIFKSVRGTQVIENMFVIDEETTTTE